MKTEEIYKKIKNEITEGVYNYNDQIAAISKWVESEFEPKSKGQTLPIDSVSNQRELLIDFADGINIHDGDRDKIGKLVDIYLKINL